MEHRPTPQLAPYVAKQLTVGAKIELGLACAALGGATFFAVDLALGHRATFERIGGGLVLLALGCFWMVKAVRTLRDPSRAPLVQELARHGPVHEVSRTIERLATTPGQQLFNGFIFAEGWIVMPGWGLSVLRCSDIAWVYEKRLQVKKSGIQVAMLRDVVLHASAGMHSGRLPFQIPVLAAQVPQFMAKVKEVAPQAVFGFDEKAHAMWAKDPAGALALLRARPPG